MSDPMLCTLNESPHLILIKTRGDNCHYSQSTDKEVEPGRRDDPLRVRAGADATDPAPTPAPSFAGSRRPRCGMGQGTPPRALLLLVLVSNVAPRGRRHTGILALRVTGGASVWWDFV